jgi:signal transduction histidine kinase
MSRFFTTLADRRTWTELLYALIALPLGIAGFVFVVVSLSVSIALAITLIGIPLLALTIVAARWLGAVYRGLGRSLLGVKVETPQVHRRHGVLGYLTEANGWRAIAFAIVQFPVAVTEFVVAVVFWSYGLGALTYPAWRLFLPLQHDGTTAHRGGQLSTHYYLDTPSRIITTAILGAVLLLIAPWAVRAVVSLDRLLIRGLLGPTAASRRIQQLQDTRTMAVDDSAATLRRIERDLHDGAQARLVSLAMSLGLAKEELDGANPDVAVARVRELVDSAHREAKGTILDLRDLARGIHPPALDNGLPDALRTLAARCTIPVQVDIDLPDRPSPAVESIVYFCTAELLTNAVKHSGAHRAGVDVRYSGDQLSLRVGDDGAGGAGITSGGGLAGLRDRVTTVDGRLDISSPEGGPTLVTVEIPR